MPAFFRNRSVWIVVLVLVLLVVVPMIWPSANVVARVVIPPVEWITEGYIAFARLFA